MTIFVQIIVTVACLILCYLEFKPSNIDKMIARETMNWESKDYPKELIINAKNILKIDYEIDDGSDVYFEIIPTEPIQKSKIRKSNSEGTIIKELIDRTPEPTMRTIHEGFSLSPLTSVIIKEIPTKYHKC